MAVDDVRPEQDTETDGDPLRVWTTGSVGNGCEMEAESTEPTWSRVGSNGNWGAYMTHDMETQQQR